MDARKHDRFADLLSQIFWHINREYINLNDDPNNLRREMLEVIEKALEINDKLGCMAEKGMI